MLQNLKIFHVCIMNQIMEGPYVTRKYWDGMIEGTIVGIGKDGAK